MNTHKRESGFSIIEALITLLVLSVGLVALAKLQGTLFQSGANARASAIATSLAQRKLEDLRTFSQVDDGGAGTFGFNEIANNAGGRENGDGTLVMPTGANYTVDNTLYTLTWTSQDFDYADDNAASTGVGVDSDYKQVVITVAWTELDRHNQDDQMTGRAMTLTGIVSSSSPTNAAHTLENPHERQGPIVKYTPGDAPDFVSVPTTDTKKKETSRPEPEISQNSEFAYTVFDEVTYDTTLKTQKREEYITVNCVCEQLGGGNDGYTPLLQQYDSETGYIKNIKGSLVSKRTGERVTTGQYGQQPIQCDACCRDHHDVTGQEPYDPFRNDTNAALAGGDHNHYFPDENGDLQLANADGDLYLESCRFKRVDGYLHVMQDWNLTNLQVMPGSFVQTNTDDYVNYVIDFVEDYITAIADNNAYATDQPEDGVDFTPTFDNEPTTHAMTTADQEQFVARGIYIDFMDNALLTEIKARIAANEYFLDITPFHEVNLTKFATWGTVTYDGADCTNIASASTSVTNEAVEDGGTHSRGLVTTSPGDNACVQASIEPNNIGLTDSVPIYDDGGTLANREDEVIIDIGDDAVDPDDIIVRGTISIAGGVGINLSDVQVAGTNGATCARLTDELYTCTLDADGNGNVVVSGYNDTKVTGNAVTVNNYDSCPATGVVADDGDLAETTTYTYAGAAGINALNINISKNGC